SARRRGSTIPTGCHHRTYDAFLAPFSAVSGATQVVKNRRNHICQRGLRQRADFPDPETYFKKWPRSLTALNASANGLRQSLEADNATACKPTAERTVRHGFAQGLVSGCYPTG
ncbi:MAG: hypothetical protein JXB62_09620, partial [Pirellulales bacterium]|nr:hypothetical protein [Pirellulales bacterium]